MKKLFKRLGLVVLGLVVILLLVGSAFFVKGNSALSQQFTVATPTTPAATDSASIAWGADLAVKYGCADCHGSQLSGNVIVDAPPFLVVASNLTSGKGGVGKTYSVTDYDRAMRHGVRPDGTPLIIMPAQAYNRVADDEAAAILGFIKSLPPVDNELPKTELRPLGRILAGAGEFDVAMEVTESQPKHRMAPPAAATIEFGKYKADMMCAYCHQANFEGGVAMGPGAIPPSIKPYGKVPLESFVQTVRTGVTPGGRVLDPIGMPTEVFKAWSDVELEAVHMYLATL